MLNFLLLMVMLYSKFSLIQLLRDDQFHGKPEGSDDSKWLVSQLMNAIDSLPLQSEETQVEIIKVLMDLCNSSAFFVNFMD